MNIHSSFSCNCQKLEVIQKSFNKCMDKQLWYIYTMENSSAIKRNELLMNTTTWVNLKIIPQEKKPDKNANWSLVTGSKSIAAWECWLGKGVGNYTRKLLGVMNMEYARYLDCGSCYMGVYICWNLSNCI